MYMYVYVYMPFGLFSFWQRDQICLFGLSFIALSALFCLYQWSVVGCLGGRKEGKCLLFSLFAPDWGGQGTLLCLPLSLYLLSCLCGCFSFENTQSGGQGKGGARWGKEEEGAGRSPRIREGLT